MDEIYVLDGFMHDACESELNITLAEHYGVSGANEGRNRCKSRVDLEI